MNHAISEKESCDQASLQTEIEDKRQRAFKGNKGKMAHTLSRVFLRKSMRCRWTPYAEARHYSLTRGERDALVN